MPTLCLNSLPLLFDHKQQASIFLRQFQPLQDLILSAAPIQTNNSKDSTVGPALIGLPKPNYPPPPPIRLNQLYWPTGAARWARGYFLASKTVAQELATTSGTAVPFMAEFGGYTLTTDLYVLPPHPISCVEGEETLWLIPVVDERYWWQFRNIGNLGKPNALTWNTVYVWLANQLGVSIPTGVLSSSYLTPDPDEFTRRYDNAATLLDAVAHSVGQRIVKQLDGTYQAISWTTSAEELDANIASRTPWEQIAGDSYTHQPIPATVTVAFPRLSCGTPDCQRRFYTISTAYSGANTVVADTVKTIHSSAWASYASQGVVTNHAELAALAARIAADYYAGLEHAHDYTFAGIKEWIFTGYDDHALYSFGTEDDQPCVTARTSLHQSGESYEADTVICEQYPRLCTTRIQSPPLNFGVDQMLHQGQTYTEPVGLLPFELATTLVPGGTCTGYPLTWNDESGSWVVDTSCLVNMADPFYRNFLLFNERCWARKNCASGYYDVVGENGLERTGLALASIQGGSSGSVLIYSGPLDNYGSPTCTRTSTGIPVSACHLPGSATVNPQDVLFLRYMPDHFKWFIRSNKGSSSVEPARIAFAKLTEAVCPQDHDSILTYVKETVLIDGTRLDPDTIVARCRFGCSGEENDLAILMRVTNPDPEHSDSASSSQSSSSQSSSQSESTSASEEDTWDIVFIEHKAITPYVRIYFDSQTSKLKGIKRRCNVMYCSDEYEEDILQGTDQCPEGS